MNMRHVFASLSGITAFLNVCYGHYIHWSTELPRCRDSVVSPMMARGNAIMPVSCLVRKGQPRLVLCGRILAPAS